MTTQPTEITFQSAQAVGAFALAATWLQALSQAEIEALQAQDPSTILDAIDDALTCDVWDHGELHLGLVELIDIRCDFFHHQATDPHCGCAECLDGEEPIDDRLWRCSACGAPSPCRACYEPSERR